MHFVGASYIAAASGTLPAHVAGDLLIVAAIRWGTGAVPTLPSGWTSLHTSTVLYSRRVAVRTATGAGTTSGTWAGAGALYVSVWRGATATTVASSASASNAAAIPPLTVGQPGWSSVATLGIPDSGQAPVPAGTVSQWTDGYTRWALTTGPVASWAQQDIAPHIVAVSIEMSPTEIDVTTSAPLAWSVEQLVTTSAALSWAVESRGTWREYIASRHFQAAVGAPFREVATRFELLDRDFRRVRDLPLTGSVAMTGTEPLRYRGSFATGDRSLVPEVSSDPLDPRGRRDVRVWWRV